MEGKANGDRDEDGLLTGGSSMMSWIALVVEMMRSGICHQLSASVAMTRTDVRSLTFYLKTRSNHDQKATRR